MSAIFEFPIASETLTPEELFAITGCVRRGEQIEWLNRNNWTFHKNKSGDPIVGRLYARLKMAGITPSVLTSSAGWSPDFSSIM